MAPPAIALPTKAAPPIMIGAILVSGFEEKVIDLEIKGNDGKTKISLKVKNGRIISKFKKFVNK